MANNNRPVFDLKMAAKIMGKYVMFGVTINDCNDNFIEDVQYHGIVVSADEKTGITVELKGFHAGETFNLPPRPDFFKPAKPGIYTFKSTKEQIENPDFEATWIKQNAPPDFKNEENDIELM